MKNNGKIRVLQAIRQGLTGGGETHVLSLVSHLDRSRFEPVVLSFTDGPMVTQLKKMGIACHVIHTERAFDLTKWRKVKSLLKQESIDVVHVHGSRAASNLFWAAGSARLPILYTIHGWSFHDDQPAFIRKLRILSEKYLTQKMDLNISVSASNQQTGQQYFSGFNSVIVNNGIDPDKFNPANKYPDIRAELGIPEDALLITFLARMTAQKAPLVLLQAFQKVRRWFSNVHLLMVGEGELRGEAEKFARERELADRVIFENFRQDVPAILSASDIYCLPSLWEGMPIGLLEAMAMKNAVVVSRVDGSKEIIIDNINGILVEPGSVNDLADSLVSLCENREKQICLQARARNTIINNYHVNSMANKVAILYKDIFNRVIGNHEPNLLRKLYSKPINV